LSRHDFPEAEFRERRARVRRAIAEAGLDWLLLINPVSIHWLTGSDAKSFQAFQCLPVAAASDRLAVFVREAERNELEADALVDEVRGWGGAEPEDPLAAFARFADELGLRRGRVGIEVPAYFLHPHHYVALRALLGDALAAEPTHLVDDLKLVKSPAELACIREAARIADVAMEAFLGAVGEGRGELELAGIVYATLLASGSGLPASAINLVTGERCAFSHGPPTARRLRRGDAGNVEFGATSRRYTATLGRQFSLGEPGARHRALHDVVRRASDACIAAIRAGVKAVVPHEAAKRVIAEAGLDRFRVHTTGYGLAPGFPPSWAEPLHLFGGSRYTLEAGMVVTVEPNVFIGAEGIGVRIADNVLVTPTGAEILSRTPRELAVIG
jgi:Xaa-Pro dipeptidase